jgi:cytochrome c oxidase cbb3-type subunit 3
MATNHDEDRLLGHSYDGIQEYDNPLPAWWVWIFWATIIFSVLYVFDFTGLLRGPGREAEYARQMAAAEASRPVDITPVDSASLEGMRGNATIIAEGKTAFTTLCSACHAMDGGGGIGPNLTDDFWIHPHGISGIRRTIAEGVLDKGMPAWEKIISPTQLNAVTVYVASIRGASTAAPKAPQGERVPPG